MGGGRDGGQGKVVVGGGGGGGGGGGREWCFLQRRFWAFIVDRRKCYEAD